ncbi:GPW/gp25 family protein [Aeromonas veronii]
MNAQTGRQLGDTDHIVQSIHTILTTPVGSRVMRREFGSELADLIDQPQHDATRLRLMAATVHAITLWEPRVRLTRVELGDPTYDGRRQLTLSWRRIDSGTDQTATLPLGNAV